MINAKCCRLVCLFLLVLTTPSALFAKVIDAPHTPDNGVRCGDCHTYSVWWQFSPLGKISPTYGEFTSSLCLLCHDGSTDAPEVVTHSSAAMGPLHRDTLPEWDRQCRDCHSVHFQEQLDWKDSVDDTTLFLAMGNMEIDTLVDNNDGTSSFRYSLSHVKPAWNDPAEWPNKSGLSRGLHLVVTASGTENSFEISDASEDSPGVGTGSITVLGVIDPAMNGAAFGIIYGQYIKKQIQVDAGAVDVKFFDGRGGFVDASLDGICQVCHTQTVYFRNDSWPEAHQDIRGAANATTLNCIECHSHDVAFGHGSDGGSECAECHNSNQHTPHLLVEITCSKCHDLTNMRDQNGDIALDLATTPVCDICHHDATVLPPGSGAPPLANDFKAGWTTPEYNLDCNGCHNSAPQYDNGTPKANSHAAHNYSCEICHFTSATSAAAIIVDGTHVNQSYDVIQGEAVTFNYTYAEGGGACDTISCHNDNSATWGARLDCVDCHLADSDIDDWDITNFIPAAINSNQWTSTGHGRDSASQYPQSDNFGADLHCSYCHSDSVLHRETSNPFRLANINGQDGLNGVCWICHKTGSQGYEPSSPSHPLVNSSEQTKIDSYHYGSRHGTGSNNGGRFCWDCHDPHGDTNLFMVHSDVAIRSNQTTGIPEATAEVVFTANATGTDYVRLDPGPYTGICNVCHTNTGYYTATSGGGHNTNTACVTCHKHSVENENEAFFQGSCKDCHSIAQDNGDNIPVGGRRAVFGEFPVANSHAHYGTLLDGGDCTVCHDMNTHMDGYVDLIDADSRAVYRFIQVADLTSDPDISDFCSSCHDADGATRLGTPLDPFGNGNQPPDAASKFSGTLQWNESYDDICYGGEGSMRPVNSHHDISDTDQEFSGAKIECLSCHGAHNVAASQKIVDPFDTSEPWTGTTNEFCLACHNGGMGPTNPAFPPGVSGPVIEMLGVPNNTPNTFCDVDPAIDEVWDCADTCVNAATAFRYIADDWCDDGGIYVYDLRCEAFQFDGEDCFVSACNDAECSSIGGIDSCEYDATPWNIDFSWGHSAHGLDSKRLWPDYIQDPPAPMYELDCIACHDAHGSYTPNNPAGNPYLLRDSIDGTVFVDDGCRHSSQSAACELVQKPGTAGEVIVGFTASGPDLAVFCVKCHEDWESANAVSHQTCGSCLTCHSHGAATGGLDYSDSSNNHTFCP